jgi:hypothetical protein
MLLARHDEVGVHEEQGSTLPTDRHRLTPKHCRKISGGGSATPACIAVQYIDVTSCPSPPTAAQ